VFLLDLPYVKSKGIRLENPPETKVIRPFSPSSTAKFAETCGIFRVLRI
jgi:hypothetical protein